MGDTQLTLAVLQMALGAFAALMVLLAYVRGVVGSSVNTLAILTP